MTVKKRKAYELEIIDLAFGGKGLAKPDGFPVFIDRVIPGDIVFAKIIKKKKSWAEGKLIKILKESSFRKQGKCQYCNYCGGCKWQSIGYDLQLEYKKKHVTDSLQHIGGLKDITVKDVIPSDNIYEYRNKMEFSCSIKRWLLPLELENDEIKKDFGIGLHVPGTFDKVIDIKQCEIMPDLGNHILEDVRNFIKASGLLAYHLRTHEGFWRFLMLRHSVAFDTWMVNIVTTYKQMDVVADLAAVLTQKYPQIESVMNNITDAKSGVSAGKEEICLYGEDHIKEKLGKFMFKISANSFFQTNTRSCEKLYSTVSEYAALTGKEVVIDLYSGTGTIPVWLSDQAKMVYGIEIVKSAVADAKQNAMLNGIENCEFLEGDIKDVLPRLKQIPDVMIIDPPRVGMHKEVVQQVLSICPEKIVYVSCNPATLARDLEMLYPKYDIKEIQPIDMFPHTYHIESVALLLKR
ncbi:MAG: 23S rRNA (uracil(1939)-C(5))-methyltransferase RlmD [Proteobacteria bacterium]|nr:23S rRNA (uracil(1939)-C(5))-methyltransferase RlmD [Pseudomonadota bacterium]MBU1583274.1 23S rRNA (uracil(1939)-C(5))-methyltransferase RlmD [Pseudomonadota bacterium]MBU2452598.1 23S rRNA (uracil(1939)-C(5))-methyltransferase RlmD [Pseudomonadota bacterium]MBU2632071.1 23S rRNA (uracil(1939)-C(5))-methyltransferase RlmD [Pseudomonadota bacterium]